MAYWDTSCLLKLYAPERDSVMFQSHLLTERCHTHMPPILLRTLDAIHAASALASGEAQIVATDNRLREAAIVLGLTVFPPP